MPRKIQLLLAVHLAVGVAPAAMFLGSPDVRQLPIVWALAGLSFGQLMVLAFWAGMGTAGRVRQLLGTIFGVLYLATWPTLGAIISPHVSGQGIAIFAMHVTLDCAMLLMFSGIFLLLRRRYAVLCRQETAPPDSPGGFQFSVLQLMLLTSLAAVVLGLIRLATGTNTAAWHEIGAYGLFIVAFVANILAAPWAVLSPGPVRLRVTVALLAAALLGCSLSFTALFKMPFEGLGIWLFLLESLSFAIPSFVLILSLLVVRSCGYRLVPRMRPVAAAKFP